MKLSIVFPYRGSPEVLLIRIQDLTSFWKKFGVPVEAIFSIDSKSGPASIFESLQTQIQTLTASSSIEVRLLRPAKISGRGPHALFGMSAATGDILALGSADFSIPLAEYFSGLQEFLMQADAEFLLVGQRGAGKKKRIGSKKGLRHFFEKVQSDKSQGLEVADPTCPFLMCRQKTWAQLEVSALPRWFYTPTLLLRARQKKIEIRSLPVQCQDNPESNFGWSDALASLN